MRQRADHHPEFSADSLLKSPTVTIRDVYCRGSHREHSEEEHVTATELIFPYRGAYVRHLGNSQAVAEANQVLFFKVDEGYRISHPIPGGDASLSLAISEHLLLELRLSLFCNPALKPLLPLAAPAHRRPRSSARSFAPSQPAPEHRRAARSRKPCSHPHTARPRTAHLARSDNKHTLRVEPKLKALQAPTLIVWGTDDVYFDVKWSHWLAENIPGTRRSVEFKYARIFFPEERWQDFNKELREHWQAA